MLLQTGLSNLSYSNNLDIKKFEDLISNNTQGYKFYWLGAILEYAIKNQSEITFDDLTNEMIYLAYRTVTFYHLSLGPSLGDYKVNRLEHLINSFNEIAKDDITNRNIDRSEIIRLTKKYATELKTLKEELTRYVPYRAIAPFLDEETNSYVKADHYNKVLYNMSLNRPSNDDLFYKIIDANKILDRKIQINSTWMDFIKDNYILIKGWLDYNKAQYIQNRNPGVPGIIYKISPESEGVRKLGEARELWKLVSKITNQPLREIYTGNELDIKKFDLDHFVPWSYVANDELWNLIPMSKTLNCSKNNKLPNWDQFFKEFANYHYYLYQTIFNENLSEHKVLTSQYKKCQKNNINAIWALEKLYIPGHSDVYFKNILEENMKPIYESAKLQHYDLWEI